MKATESMLRNKHTGEIKTLTEVIHEAYVKHELESLAKLNEEWEDYEPQEPLIKDEKIRKAIEYIFPEYALIYIEKQGGKRIFEFGGTRLEMDAPNENAIKHGLSYCIDELCGEEE